MNQKTVESDHTAMESLIPEEPDRYKSVLTLPEGSTQRSSMYSCVLTNEFGTTQMSIVLHNQGINNIVHALKYQVRMLHHSACTR